MLSFLYGIYTFKPEKQEKWKRVILYNDDEKRDEFHFSAHTRS